VRFANTFLVAVLGIGCASDTNSVVELGIIEFYEMQPMIDAPDDAVAGLSFDLNLTTYGSGCITHESTEVTIRSDDADVELFDRRQIPGDGEACPSNLTYIAHGASIPFTSPGIKRVRIHDRRVAPNVDEPIEAPLEITIR
jgi:hypothetical protein